MVELEKDKSNGLFADVHAVGAAEEHAGHAVQDVTDIRQLGGLIHLTKLACLKFA